MRIDLFAHFTTQEFRQAYLSIPLGAKGRRLDPLAIRTFVQAQRTTDIDVLRDMEQRLRVLDRYGTLTLFSHGGGSNRRRNCGWRGWPTTAWRRSCNTIRTGFLG